MPWVPPTFWKSHNIWASALKPASLLYGRIHKTLYRATTPYQSALPVICIGNVQLGGSGKTPVTQAIVKLMAEGGLVRNPVILLRGYGGRLKGPSTVDPARHSAADVGDEALLHAHYTPTIISAQREAGARLAETAGHDCIIMDDGLQNNQLAKTMSFLVFNSEQGLGNALTFPAGPLRETIEAALDKVSALIRIGPDLPFEKDLPVFDCHLSAPAAPDPHQSYIAFCGIGQPDKFLHTLQTHHYSINEFIAYADHQPYTDTMLADLEAKAQEQGARLITTEKDYMRLPADFSASVDVLKISYRFDKPDAILAHIRQAMDA